MELVATALPTEGVTFLTGLSGCILSHQFGISVVLTHVRSFTYPYMLVGKIKTERPHVGRTPIRGVIVIIKWHHRGESEVIHGFLEAFSCFSNLRGELEKESIIRVRMG